MRCTLVHRLHLLGILAALPGMAGPVQSDEIPAETIVIFLQESATPVETAFRKNTLPAIEALGKRLGMSVAVRDARAGAPPEITATPAIVYQGFRGRSLYQGRSTTLDRLEGFLVTSRRVPQSNATLERKDVSVWSAGRARIATKVKVTSLTGERPEGLDDATFADEVRGGIVKGLKRFRWQSSIQLARGDRTFYLDCYPYRSPDGALYLSGAIYSQYNCVEPIFRVQDPLTAPWEARNDLAVRLGSALELGLFEQLTSPRWGDGLLPVSKQTDLASWEDLGFRLPPPPDPGTGSLQGAPPLGRRWRVAPAKGSNPSPPVLFHFQEPLDYYRGVVETLHGELLLNQEASVAGATGWMEVETASVSMGDAELDHSIHDPLTLAVKEHPRSRFTVDRFLGDDLTLVYGESRSLAVAGRFRLKTLEIPLEARLILQPVVTADGEPRVRVEGTFTLRLKEPFGLLGPDGPAPMNDTLVFTLDFELAPANPGPP